MWCLWGKSSIFRYQAHSPCPLGRYSGIAQFPSSISTAYHSLVIWMELPAVVCFRIGHLSQQGLLAPQAPEAPQAPAFERKTHSIRACENGSRPSIADPVLDFPSRHSRSDAGHFEPSVRLGRERDSSTASAASVPILSGHLWNFCAHCGADLALLHLHRPGDHPRAGRTTSSAQTLPHPRCETAWWFGTIFILPYIGNNNPSWLIFFQKGWNHQPGNVSAAQTITVNPPLGRHFHVTVCWCIECWRGGLARPQMGMSSHMWRGSIGWSEKSFRLSCCQVELWDSLMQSRWRGAAQFLGFQTSFHGGRTPIWPVSWWKSGNLLNKSSEYVLFLMVLWIFMDLFVKSKVFLGSVGSFAASCFGATTESWCWQQCARAGSSGSYPRPWKGCPDVSWHWHR